MSKRPNIRDCPELNLEEAVRFTGEPEEDIIDKTLVAWSEQSDYAKRTLAATYGAEREWEKLWDDESYSVRGAVAQYASEPYKLRLIRDSEPVIREWLARYGSENVRARLVELEETDLSVVEQISRSCNGATKEKMLEIYWDKPEYLRRIIPYLSNIHLMKLTAHPSLDVRLAAGQHGSRSVCNELLKQELGINRFIIEDRIEELNDLEDMLGFTPKQSPLQREAEKETEINL